MDLLERISRLKPEQQKLLELTLIRQGVDIREIPITAEYGKNHPHYPLALEQEPMWVIEKLDPDNPSYDAPGTVSLEGNLKPEVLERSINEVVKRHDILRAVFITDRDKPVQVILPSLTLRLERIDLKGLADDEQEERMKQLREDNRLYKFDLASGPLVKTLLVEQGGNRAIFITIMHHIISDLLSLKIFLKEVAWFYKAFSRGKSPLEALPELSCQYVDYACWQRRWYRESLLGSEARKGQETFWLDMFKEEAPVLNLPTDYPRPALKSYEGAHGFFSLKGEKLRVLKEIFLKEGTTLYVVLLSVFYIFLAKISGQEDIVVGSPINGRQNKALKDMIGLFVKTLPLRNYPRGDKTFKAFLSEVNTRVLNLFKNQDYSYEELVRKSVKERDASRNPLFDVLFNFIYIDMNEIEMPGLSVKPYRFKPKRVGFDLELVCEGTYEELFFKLSYCTKLFKEETVNRFISYLQKVLEAGLADQEVTISAIGIISREEQEQVLFEFNNTAAVYPREKTIVRVLEEQLVKNPGHIAAVFENHQLSARGLFETYHRVAGILRTKGVGPDVIVGLMADRSLEMLAGILGILKAGGAYLPIDPGYPGDRIEYMLADSGVTILLVAGNYSGDRKRATGEDKKNLEILPLDFSTPRLFTPSPPPSAGPGHPLASSPTHLCYVIYTSGSTGKPKGVMINHYSLINRLNWMQRFYPLGEEDVILQKTPITFDVSLWELFWWSFPGAKLCLLGPGQEKNPGAIVESVQRNKVTTMHFVPSMLNAFLEYVEESLQTAKLKSLKQVFASGEALLPRHAAGFSRLLEQHSGTQLINLYGPTEATVDVSYYHCRPTEKEHGQCTSIPIGKPIDNIYLYVVDKGLRLQGIGIPGELCIGGIGLARGYLNNPALTHEKFYHDLKDYRDSHEEKNRDFCRGSRGAGVRRTHPIRDGSAAEDVLGNSTCTCHLHLSPLAKSAPLAAGGKKLYRTGDMARWLRSGDIEFLGRMDHQVKIRGNRIELGEIESHLLNHEGIKETAVAAREDRNGNHYLCAYIVCNDRQQRTTSELREYLAGKLPDYMIPSYFIPLEKIPLTPNGKVDQKNLPGPLAVETAIDQAYTAPTQEVEKKLAEIWEELLDRKNIGIHDNFFTIGGESIKAIQVVSRMIKAGYDLQMTDIFQYPRISQLAGLVKKQKRHAGQSIITGLVPLTPIRHEEQVESHPRHGGCTPADFPLATIDQPGLDTIAAIYRSREIEIEDIFALSPGQQGMIFHHLYSPDSSVTVEQQVFQITSPLDIQAFRQVWQTLLDRHAAFRASFHWQGLEEHLQVIHKNLDLPFEARDWRDIPPPEQEAGLKQFLETDRRSGFDLTIPPLMRVSVFQLGESLTQVVWTYHHLLLDGWCLGILTKEVAEVYESYPGPGREPVRLAPAPPFKNYIRWLKNQDREKAETYWRRYLKGFSAPIRVSKNLPYFQEDTAAANRPYGVLEHECSPGLCQRFSSLTQRWGITLNTLVQGAWALLLSQYSGERDIVFGTTVSGRPPELPDALTMIGCFMNTIPFRVDVAPTVSVESWLLDLQLTHAHLQQFDYIGLAAIRACSEIRRTSGLYDLYETILVFENFPRLPGKQGELLSTVAGSHIEQQMDYPLTLYAFPQPHLSFILLWDTRFFNEAAVRQLRRHLVYILEQISAENIRVLGQISPVPEADARLMLEKWNNTAMDFPREKTLEHWFRQQVEKTPHSTALVFEDTRLTYKELNYLSDHLARSLQARGVNPRINTIVGLLLTRSLEMAAVVLAVLKAGGAYLPIDPGCPGERIEFMLADSQAKVLVASPALSAVYEKLTIAPSQLIRVGNGLPEPVPSTGVPLDHPPLRETANHSGNLAYIIYTTGTTGRPKGVGVEHRNVVNLLTWFGTRYGLKNRRHVLQMSDYVFDPSIEQILGTLVYGSTLYLVPRELIMDPPGFRRFLEERQVDLINFVPGALKELLLSPAGKIHCLQTVISGGERLDDRTKDGLLQQGYQLYNHYGPTEMTVDVLTSRCSPRKVHLGKPIANAFVYILAQHNRLTPPGVPGELCAAGAGVARGYLNNPELTAARFCLWRPGGLFSRKPPPWPPRKSVLLDQSPITKNLARRALNTNTLYKTGDLARWLPDGNIEFLGRIDHQVKVRGFRIELAEIENCLNRYEAIDAAVVLDRADADGTTYLCAYLVPGKEKEDRESFLNIDELRNYLTAKLPGYMIPAEFIQVDRIPVTLTGKIDNQALQNSGGSIKSIVEYAPPGNETEKKLALLWADLLKRDRVGIHDNFFNLGGQSILAMKLISMIKTAFDVKIPLINFFQIGTIQGIAQMVMDIQQKNQTRPLKHKEKTGVRRHESRQAGSGAQDGERVQKIEDNLLSTEKLKKIKRKPREI